MAQQYLASLLVAAMTMATATAVLVHAAQGVNFSSNGAVPNDLQYVLSIDGDVQVSTTNIVGTLYCTDDAMVPPGDDPDATPKLIGAAVDFRCNARSVRTTTTCDSGNYKFSIPGQEMSFDSIKTDCWLVVTIPPSTKNKYICDALSAPPGRKLILQSIPDEYVEFAQLIVFETNSTINAIHPLNFLKAFINV